MNEIILLLLLLNTVVCHGALPNFPFPFLIVSGTGEVEVLPDVVKISFNVVVFET